MKGYQMAGRGVGLLVGLLLMGVMLMSAGCDSEEAPPRPGQNDNDIAIAAQIPTQEPSVPTATTQIATATVFIPGMPALCPTPTATEVPPTPTATSTATQVPPEPTPTTQAAREPVVVNGRTYDAYIPAASKKGQWYHYTCEFDAAWAVLKTYGFDVGLEKQVELVGLDTSIEPYYRETKDGVFIYGGDITKAYSGDYKENFLARSSGEAMRKVFEHYDLHVTAVNTREGIESALLRGELVWIKTTVDFKPWVPATWVMPDGRTYKTVLGNDHAAVVMGFNSKNVVIRDVLGPTSTNWNRVYEYEVSWDKFMKSWGAQSFDGLAVAPPSGQ
jgi:hypothetical protein